MVESESFSAICGGKFSLLQRRLRRFNLPNGNEMEWAISLIINSSLECIRVDADVDKRSHCSVRISHLIFIHSHTHTWQSLSHSIYIQYLVVCAQLSSDNIFSFSHQRLDSAQSLWPSCAMHFMTRMKWAPNVQCSLTWFRLMHLRGASWRALRIYREWIWIFIHYFCHIEHCR